MSPVNEELPLEEIPTSLQRFVIKSRDFIGASDRMPVRVLILFILSICCVTLAPVPANLLGVAAVVLLALDTAIHRR